MDIQLGTVLVHNVLQILKSALGLCFSFYLSEDVYQSSFAYTLRYIIANTTAHMLSFADLSAINLKRSISRGEYIIASLIL